MKTFLSKLGQSFMLPIALLPAAGIMLGIGGSFTGPQLIEAYNLQNVLGEGTILGGLLGVMNAAGGIVFSSLPLMFAIAVAIAFAKTEKGSAALAAVMSYLVMNAVMGGAVQIFNLYKETADGGYNFLMFGNEYAGLITKTLGIDYTMNMGVFGGIIVGGITAFLQNKYGKTELPEFLGFFGGARFIPIISTFAALFYGIAFVFIWPPIGMALSTIGSGFTFLSAHNLGFIASFIHGYIERALIPMGLHHVYYLPLWQTSVGGTYEIAGAQIAGTQNAFFEALKTGDWATFPSTNFMTGKFPVMMFGLPAAAYAMYSVADDENKKKASGLLFSVGLTSFLTGITEPIEFTFLFLAPGLYYGFHAVMAGISFALMDLLNVRVGMTFSGGLIDFLMFGVLPGTTGVNNHWYWIPVVGIIIAPIYFIVFKWYIVKFDVPTPGRNGAELKMVSKQDYKDAKGDENSSSSNSDNPELDIAEKIVEGLGGKENIETVDACITRLRVGVIDENKVEEDAYFKALGAHGLNKSGKAIQVIYGAKAAKYKAIIEEEIL